MSREALAKDSGVSLSTIRRIEEGERPGNVDQLAALCDALGVSLSLFFKRAEERRQAMRDDVEIQQKVIDIFDGPEKSARKRTSPLAQPRKRAARKDKDPDA